MGATVIGYWPGITEEQIEGQPGFYNDCKAWGNWMAEREGEPDVLQAVRDLGAAAILTVMTDGMDENDVEWVAPRELRDAAQKLQRAVEEGRPGIARILEVYGRHANGMDSLAEEFLTDLADIEAIALWAEEQGVRSMTLEVNW